MKGRRERRKTDYRTEGKGKERKGKERKGKEGREELNVEYDLKGRCTIPLRSNEGRKKGRKEGRSFKRRSVQGR